MKSVFVFISLVSCNFELFFDNNIDNLIKEQVISDGTCRVLFTSNPSGYVGDKRINVILTDSLSFVSSLQPFELSEQKSPEEEELEDPRVQSNGFARTATLSNDQIIGHIDNVTAFYVPEDIEGLLAKKTETISFVIPVEMSGKLSDSWNRILSQVRTYFGNDDHIYIVNRTVESYRAAFEKYRYSLIMDVSPDKVSDAFLHSFGFHTLPAFNGFFKVSTMFANAVAAYNETHFHLDSFLGLLDDLTRQQRFIWSYQQMLQDVLYYRYHQDFETRLNHHAKSLCDRKTKLAFVGLYSAKNNFEKRMAVRDTWLQVFKAHGFEYKFFLAYHDDENLRTENETYSDMVMLNVSEGYRQNSRKGLMFLEWVANNRGDASFLIKADDDIYLRPEPLIKQIMHRIPAGYIWGYFDYISPVPRVKSDVFFNGWDDYPFYTFPSYPRGVVRVMSMDTVNAISKLSEANELRMIFGDDPCLGVHMRQSIYGSKKFPQITMDDFGSYTRFAMEPTCEKTWSSMVHTSWTVHHVNAEEIRCMWRSDIRNGLYSGVWQSSADLEYPSICDCVEATRHL